MQNSKTSPENPNPSNGKVGNAQNERPELRLPNEREKTDLREYLMQDAGLARGEASGVVDASYIGVFPHYKTDSPGYGGRLLFVVYPASPDMYETYIWRKGDLELCPLSVDYMDLHEQKRRD